MSTIAAAHGFGTTRTPVRRAAPTVARVVPPTAAAPVRLTRRGRLILLATFVALVFAALTVWGGQSAATNEPGAPVETRMVEIGEGDTLWAIASDLAEPGAVRQMVHQIEELNALSGAGLAIGQEIAVPVE